MEKTNFSQPNMAGIGELLSSSPKEGVFLHL